MKKPRTKKELLADPRTATVTGEAGHRAHDVLWNDGENGWWCVLADGHNFWGCSCIHEDTIKELCEALEQVTEGPTY